MTAGRCSWRPPSWPSPSSSCPPVSTSATSSRPWRCCRSWPSPRAAGPSRCWCSAWAPSSTSTPSSPCRSTARTTSPACPWASGSGPRRWWPPRHCCRRPWASGRPGSCDPRCAAARTPSTRWRVRPRLPSGGRRPSHGRLRVPRGHGLAPRQRGRPPTRGAWRPAMARPTLRGCPALHGTRLPCSDGARGGSSRPRLGARAGRPRLDRPPALATVHPRRPQRLAGRRARRASRPLRRAHGRRPGPRGRAGPRLPARAAGGHVLRRGLPRPYGDRVPAGLGVRAAARHLRVHPPPPRQVRHGLGHPAGRGQRGHRHRAAGRPVVDAVIERAWSTSDGAAPSAGDRLYVATGSALRSTTWPATPSSGSCPSLPRPSPSTRAATPSTSPTRPAASSAWTPPVSRRAPTTRPTTAGWRRSRPAPAPRSNRLVVTDTSLRGHQHRLHQHLRHGERGAALGTLLVRRLGRPGAALGGACRRGHPPALRPAADRPTPGPRPRRCEPGQWIGGCGAIDDGAGSRRRGGSPRATLRGRGLRGRGRLPRRGDAEACPGGHRRGRPGRDEHRVGTPAGSRGPPRHLHPGCLDAGPHRRGAHRGRGHLAGARRRTASTTPTLYAAAGDRLEIVALLEGGPGLPDDTDDAGRGPPGGLERAGQPGPRPR